jgi:glycosyltransferase involved in cell wall biosynthesis
MSDKSGIRWAGVRQQKVFMASKDAEDGGWISVIIAAYNEEAYIGSCLEAVLAQDNTAGRVEIVVVANACTDHTVEVVQSFAKRVQNRGWHLKVLEIAEAGKVNALNRGDQVAVGVALIYLDADVLCDPALLGQIRGALNPVDPLYATGTLQVARAKTWVTRRYADLWTRLPFVKGGAVGAGLFAVNRAGRARWGPFPEIISDDTFVRLQFNARERVEVPARYHWPMVEGFSNLVRVRRRQDAGVDEIYRLYPDLRENEEKQPLRSSDLLALAARVPVGFVIYMLVHVARRLRAPTKDWTRGR